MSKDLVVALPSPIKNIYQYQSLVESIPELDEEEERSLAERYRSGNDLEAAWRLIVSNLRYVVYIARGYTGYGLPQEDLIQEGNIGLMQAVQRFDPSRGVRLLTYAAYWIRAAIHDFILKNWRIVKIATTKARRKLFYKLRGAKKRLEWLSRAEADEIADFLDVPPEDVIDMEGKMYLADEAFDPMRDADQEAWAPADYLGDNRFEPDALVTEQEFVETAAEELHRALDSLDERSRDILQSRRLVDRSDRPTLQELGERYGITAERVRQIENEAIDRLRDIMVPRLGFDGAIAA